MEELIKKTSFKVKLQNGDGKFLTAYMYASDERIESIEPHYSCRGEKIPASVSRVGHYYIYLYDEKKGSFLPTRTKVFSDFHELRFNVEGSGLIVLSGLKQHKPDVLIISQYGDCSGDFFDAYGFYKDKLSLKNYLFAAGKRKVVGFYGRISKYQVNNSLVAYTTSENYGLVEWALCLSDNEGEIELQPA